VSGFSSGLSNIWDKSNFTTRPKQVFIDGTVGTLVASRAACTAPGDWFWGSNTLSVYAASDPSGNVEASQRSNTIDFNSKDYVTLSGFTLTRGQGPGSVNVTGNYATVSSNTITQNYYRGVYAINVGHFTLDSNTIYYNGLEESYEGVLIALGTTTPNTSTGDVFANNVLHDNGSGINTSSGNCGTMRHTNLDFHGNTSYNNSSGLYPGCADNITIHDNMLYNNTLAGSENYGIGMTSINNSQIYNNRIYNNANDGIQLYGDSISSGSGNEFYNNLIYGQTIHGFESGFDLNCNCCCSNNKLHHNVIYGNTYNIRSGSVAGGNSGNKFYNNTLYGATESNVIFTSDNQGIDLENNILSASTNEDFKSLATITTGLTLGHNLYYNSSNNLVNNNGATYTAATITSWESSAVTGDPKFNNAAGGNFTLEAGSPAIDAGANLGSPYQMGLNPQLTFPWNALNQNNQGSGWEIGAFVFVQHIPPAPPASLSVTVQ